MKKPTAKQATITILAWVSLVLFVMLYSILTTAETIPPTAIKYRSILTRQAHFLKGLNAPIPMYAAQIEQESGWRPGVTSWDKGRGLAQFMDGTTSFAEDAFPELGKADPYNPSWAIPAMIRYDSWIAARVKGVDFCNTMAAALKGYNAGVGYVQQAQKVSSSPGHWFGKTEYITTRQSAKNFEYSRLYPRWVLFKRQPKYASWGFYTCKGELQ